MFGRVHYKQFIFILSSTAPFILILSSTAPSVDALPSTAPRSANVHIDRDPSVCKIRCSDAGKVSRRKFHGEFAESIQYLSYGLAALGSLLPQSCRCVLVVPLILDWYPLEGRRQ